MIPTSEFVELIQIAIAAYYLLTCYLFVGSVIHNDIKDKIAPSPIVSFNTLILAPITAPIIAGYLLVSK